MTQCVHAVRIAVLLSKLFLIDSHILVRCSLTGVSFASRSRDYQRLKNLISWKTEPHSSFFSAFHTVYFQTQMGETPWTSESALGRGPGICTFNHLTWIWSRWSRLYFGKQSKTGRVVIQELAVKRCPVLAALEGKA